MLVKSYWIWISLSFYFSFSLTLLHIILKKKNWVDNRKENNRMNWMKSSYLSMRVRINRRIHNNNKKIGDCARTMCMHIWKWAPLKIDVFLFVFLSILSLTLSLFFNSIHSFIHLLNAFFFFKRIHIETTDTFQFSSDHHEKNYIFYEILYIWHFNDAKSC